MKIRIAIPVDKIFSRFSEKIKELSEKFEITFFELDESKCFDLFLSNKIDVVFVSPLTYGSHIGKADVSIIPVSALSLYGYSETASIIFKENLKTFETLATTDSKNYLFNIAKLVLAERYDMDIKVILANEPETELLHSADAAFILGKSIEKPNSLDLGEEWLDTFEMPLPLAFWVCKTEEYPENILEIMQELSSIVGLAATEVIEQNTVNQDLEQRQGSILYEFNKEFEESLAQTFHFLFYHQLIPEIPEIKILGREEEIIIGN